MSGGLMHAVIGAVSAAKESSNACIAESIGFSDPLLLSEFFTPGLQDVVFVRRF
jgi:hypothetical protein